MPEKILLIEDDRELGAQIVGHLRGAGFDPMWWHEGRRIPPGSEPNVALVILDLMLPGAHGMDVLRDLRVRSGVPVLVLSARNDTWDKVQALKLGADDYMTKPFWPEELLERVRARLRRPTLQRQDLIEIGEVQVALETREVRVAGERVELTRVEFEILIALMRRDGAAITRGWLTEHILGSDGTERTLDVHISRLRKKLGSRALIETVWGIGYRFVGGRDA
jgi:two-component system response regulator MtrA